MIQQTYTQQITHEIQLNISVTGHDDNKVQDLISQMEVSKHACIVSPQDSQRNFAVTMKLKQYIRQIFSSHLHKLLGKHVIISCKPRRQTEEGSARTCLKWLKTSLTRHPSHTVRNKHTHTKLRLNHT